MTARERQEALIQAQMQNSTVSMLPPSSIIFADTSTGNLRWSTNDFALTNPQIQTPPAGSEAYVEAAQKAGFASVTTALASRAQELKQESHKRSQLAVATEHYPWITPAQVATYQKKLRQSTERRTDRWSVHFEQLKFEELGSYYGLPPLEVVERVREAKERNVFSQFQVISVTQVTETVRSPEFLDPIVIAMVSGDERMFVIAQWGDDVRYEDIVQG